MTHAISLTRLVSSPVVPASIWIAAFICALYPVNAYQLEWYLGAVLLVFAYGYVMLSRTMQTGWTLAKSPVLILGGLFWLLVIASVFWSDIKPVSLIALCLFSAMPITFFAGVIGRDEGFLKKIGCMLGVVFAVLCLWAVFQFFFLNNYFLGQARHPLADPSSLGALFSLALFGSLYRVLRGEPGRGRVIAVILCILLVWGIMATASRGPVFAFIPGAIVLCVLLWRQVRAQAKMILLIAACGAVFYGLTLTNIQKRVDLGQRLFDTVTMGVDDVTNNRIDIWSATVDMIKDRPVLGTGIGTYFLYYPEYRRTSDESGTFLAHNDPLQFWAELGILGPLLFYAFGIAAALRTFAALKNMKEDGRPQVTQDRVLTVTLFAGLVSMVVQSHVSFSHYNLSILMLAGLMLALWFLITARYMPEEKEATAAMPRTVSGPVNRLVLVLPFVMAGWLLSRIIVGEIYAGKASQSLFKEQIFDFQHNINMAGSVSHGLNFRAYLLAVNVPMSILDFKKDSASAEEKDLLLQQIRGYMDIVLSINPRSADAHYYLGAVQKYIDKDKLPADMTSPEEYFRTALRLDPLHIGARLALLDLLKKQGRPPQDQIALMEEGMPYVYISPLAENFYGEMARLYLESGKVKKAQETLITMKKFKDRSRYSFIRQNTTIPQAIMGGEQTLPKFY